MLLKELGALPERIQDTLKRTKNDQGFQVAMKTDLKPDATIPYLWIVLTANHFLLCNTHKRRGLTAAFPWSDINCVRLSRERFGRAIEVIHESLDKETDVIPLPHSASKEEIEALVRNCQDSVVRNNCLS